MSRFSISNDRQLNDVNAVNLNVAGTLNAPNFADQLSSY